MDDLTSSNLMLIILKAKKILFRCFRRWVRKYALISAESQYWPRSLTSIPLKDYNKKEYIPNKRNIILLKKSRSIYGSFSLAASWLVSWLIWGWFFLNRCPQSQSLFITYLCKKLKYLPKLLIQHCWAFG